MNAFSSLSLKATLAGGGLAAVLALASLPAAAHCDTLDGPVVAEARTALAGGDITPVLKWVAPADEPAIHAAFDRTLAAREQGDAARDLADHYFFETLVRIHRAAEGAPYTGLKPGEAVDPAVALADRALEQGSVDRLVAVLTGAVEDGLRRRFAEAAEANAHADDSVAAGRAFVKAYVEFTHYAEGLHGMVRGHAEPAAGQAAHAH